MNLHQVIKSAVSTEKSVAGQELGKHTFIVHADATKNDIKNAFKEFWGVEAENVRIIKMPKKFRVAGKKVPQVKRLEKKKAIITVKAGEKFELLKFASKKTKKTEKKATAKKEVKTTKKTEKE